ncbi:MAG TPA: GNAT family N-acetyltransferase [Symbiobacteriaceae bacterium]|nr:GNAT family N-acetyltransferase [Symbiobacteriaceae bacterium]
MPITLDVKPMPALISALRTQRARLVPAQGDGYYRSRLEGHLPLTISLDGSVIGYALLERHLPGRIGVVEFYIRAGCGRYLTPAWEAVCAEVEPDYLLVRTDDPIVMLLAYDLRLPLKPDALYMEREAMVRLPGRPGLELQPLTADTFEEAYAILAPEDPWVGGHTEEDREPMQQSIGTFRYNTLLLDGKVVGVGMLKEEEEGLLDIGMVIHQAYRRQGLASYLLANLSSDMEAQGYRVMAGLAARNIGSRKSLEKAGFRVVYGWWTPDLR